MTFCFEIKIKTNKIKSNENNEIKQERIHMYTYMYIGLLFAHICYVREHRHTREYGAYINHVCVHCAVWVYIESIIRYAFDTNFLYLVNCCCQNDEYLPLFHFILSLLTHFLSYFYYNYRIYFD